MQIDVGYFYFIKDSFFDIMDDPDTLDNRLISHPVGKEKIHW